MSSDRSSPSRLPKLAPQELTEQQRQVYDAIVGGPRGQGSQLFRLADDRGRLEGPFNMMLFSPQVGLALQELGAAIRYATVLTATAREVAILTVAAYFGCEYEWHAHAALGSHAGIPDEVLVALRAQAVPQLPDPAERVAHQAATELLRHHVLGEETFRTAVAAFGERGVVELVVLVGYYSLLAIAMSAFEVGWTSSSEPA